MKLVLWVVLASLAAFALYVRFAPSDPARWHVAVVGDDADFAGGLRRVLPGRAGDLGRLDAIIRATPRTNVLAGQVSDGRITYVTRSRLWWFPDYVTVEARGSDLAVWSRLRFGGSDLGVNAARLSRWLNTLG
jgi:hypothetical protein